jgi:uncharacterized membrane protein YphA (DoxX/SURF4 family)
MRFYLTWLSIFRIFSGTVWLSYGLDKFRRPFMPPTGYMVDFIQKAAHNTTGFYHEFLLYLVLPHATIFAELSRWGEVLVGILLLTGLFARVGGIGGVLLTLNYMPANYAFWQYQIPLLQLPDAQVLALSAISVVFPTGLVFGADGVLRTAITRKPAVKPQFLPDTA